MPCAGCKKRMTDPKGNFKMRFVGKPNGKFMKGAPGNFIHGEVYKVPFNHSRFPFWELLEETPVLVAPEPSDEDDVFDDAVFIPDEPDVTQPVIEVTASAPVEEAAIELTPSTSIEDSEVSYGSLDSPATIEPYMTLDGSSGRLKDYVEPPPKPVEEEVVAEKPDRKTLLKVLSDAGVDVKKGTRTTTLEKMVDELVSEE